MPKTPKVSYLVSYLSDLAPGPAGARRLPVTHSIAICVPSKHLDDFVKVLLWNWSSALVTSHMLCCLCAVG